MVAAGALLPLAVAGAWVPLRESLPNTDVALVLVAALALVAWLGGRRATVLGAVVAALAFEYLHTRPYERWRIDHPRDVATTVVIALVGMLVGELTLRVVHHRALADRGSRDLAVMSETAELIAVGDDPGLVLGAVAGELIRLLDLVDCEFAAGPPHHHEPWVARGGGLIGAERPPGRPPEILALPVWVQGEVMGHYRMSLRGGGLPRSDRLALALSLADQAGAALALAPPRPLPPAPHAEPRLRLVESDPAGRAAAPAGPASAGPGLRAG